MHPRFRSALRLTALLLVWVVVAACASGGEPSDEPPTPEPPTPSGLPEGFSFVEASACADPVEGLVRFTEDGAARGLPAAGEVGQRGRSTLLARDLDGDGDVDLVYSLADELEPQHSVPAVFANDGAGQFSRVAVEALDEFESAAPSTLLAVDLDGDDLPELLLGTENWVLVLDNQGAMVFSEPRVLAEVGDTLLGDSIPAATGLAMKFSVGDADGDGDLDLAVFGGPPSVPPSEGEGGSPADSATLELVLLLESGELSSQLVLEAPGGGTLSLAGTFTDRDNDGDQDLLVTTDLNLVGSFWRNDGPDGDGMPAFVDDAAEVGADLAIAAMGLDSADLNGDGLLDYCITDTAPPACLLSDGLGSYYEGGAALGLQPAVPVGGGGTLGWGFDLADLDNDGFLDAAQASGRAGNIGPEEYDADYPDLLWAGQEDGTFVDSTEAVGFGDVGDNYGLVTADLNGDGWLEIVVLGPERIPRVYGNRCGSGAWLDIDLRGSPGNTEGYGARVEVTTPAGTQMREVQSLRGLGQGPALLHFGLGAQDSVEQLRIHWSDGEIQEAPDLPTRGRLTVRHPTAR